MKKKYFYLIFILIFTILFSSPLYPQTDIEKATREVDRFDRKGIEEKLRPIPEKPPEEKIEKPVVEKEEEKFFIKTIELVGCESFFPQEFSSILEKYQNREVSFADLKTLSKEIEQEYLNRGIIAAVFVPPQEIKEETVILQVVEARMGELQIQDHKYFKKQRLNYYWKIEPDDILRYDQLSRNLQIMNKNPDREVKATLHAGTKPGTTDVLLTAKTQPPMHLTSTFDKEGSDSTGTDRWGVGVRHNNFLGLDDSLLTGYSFGKNFNGAYVYHNLPISPNGASLVYGYSRSHATPKEDYSDDGLESDSKTTSITLHQDLYKKGNYLGEVSFGFSAKDKRTITNSGVYNRDRLRVLNLGGSFVRYGTDSVTYLTPEFSQGIDGLGASEKGNPLASRGAKSAFSKFNLGIQHKKSLPHNLQASFKFEGQVSSTKLMPQEEFYLGGINSVRGYPSGDFLADNVVQSNLELLIPAFFIPKKYKFPYAQRPFRDEVTALVFLDYGYGKRRGSDISEKKSANFASAGPGLRIKLFDQAILRLEWGFRFADQTISEEGDSRFHFSLDFEDKFPEEIERLRLLLEEENIKQWAWQLLNEEIKISDSPLRNKLYGNLKLAKTDYKEENLSEAKERYEIVSNLGKSLYEQTETYVRGCIEHQKKLKEYQQEAEKYFNEGNYQKAKEIYQKIITEAVPKELALEY